MTRDIAIENTEEIKIRGTPLNFWTPNPDSIDRSLAVLALFHELGSLETVGWPAIWHQTCRRSEPKSRSNRKVVVSPRGERPRPGTVLVPAFITCQPGKRLEFFSIPTNQPDTLPGGPLWPLSYGIARLYTRAYPLPQPVTGEIGFVVSLCRASRTCLFERCLINESRNLELLECKILIR